MRTKKKTGKAPPPAKGTEPTAELLRDFIRAQGNAFLDDPNINSIGIGHKVTGGKRSEELCLQFTVNKKLKGGTQLEAVGSSLIPTHLEFNGVSIPTDVIERKFHPSYAIVAQEQKADRKRRLDPMRPGISVSHPAGTAGTIGAFVYDATSGAPCILSNWHVLHTPTGQIGDVVVQPGPFDDNRVDTNVAGALLRSHLGVAGDCAVAKVEARGFDPSVLDLNVKITQLAKPELGDRLVKSGRTTAVTYGMVRRTDTLTKIQYGGDTGEQRIGGFEIGPDEERPAAERQISQGGDSGSAWLVVGEDGKPSGIMAGLHFAGEGKDDPDDHAMACYAHSVFQKLDIGMQPPATPVDAEAVGRKGYQVRFLGTNVPAPDVTNPSDVYDFRGSPLIPYTHFSVCLSISRRMARFVAWNIDGGQLKAYGRKGLDFELDPDVDEGHQIGNEAYVGNKLDRGHIARRADLVWGPKAEATRANEDSFYYTNITPQHQAFNQSQRFGLWGLLENAIFEDVDVDDLKVSIVGGPIFKSGDMEYRGIRIPASFWKAIFFKESGQLRAKAYVLTQDDLLNDIEALELDAFRLYQVSLAEVETRAKVRFAAALKTADAFVFGAIESVARPERAASVREVLGRPDLIG